MFANRSWNRGRQAFWAAALLVMFLPGCATTTTTTLETTMHSDEAALRFQSYDVTARVQMEMKR
ncbi:MAG TPA: hypothetical protein VGN42_08265 [Pirellulales bacterium]|nr:hypothetical protein [Pirellulales bacterium]